VNIFNGERVRTDHDQLAAELALLSDPQQEIATRYIKAALDAEEAADAVREAERVLRRCQADEDEAILASRSTPAPDRIDLVRAVIAANQ
jgi:hypothetical protein